MNNPNLYVIVNNDDMAAPDPECWETGSNLDWCKGRAKQLAESRRGTTVVYKLVPVFEVRLEVITNVLVKDLSEDAEGTPQ